ncbi:MAG TPA: hypothetical protein VK845_09525, partial [Gemmatimonadales bacterium]|nr:hypothetical protein [Gemmatimonadales bacterium]
MHRLRLLALAAALVMWSGVARAQGIAFEAARLLEDPDWSSYRLVLSGTLTGPLGYGLLGALFRDRDQLDQRLWGLGADLTLFRGGVAGPYAVAGLTGGLGTGEADDLWASWSAGLGYEVFPLPFLTAALEGRYRNLTPGSHSGVELGVRLGVRWGGGGRGGKEPRTSARAVSPVSAGGASAPSAPGAEPGAFAPPEEMARVLEAV